MRCRVGDLAVIVRDEDFPQDIGRFCTVVRAMTAHDRYEFGDEGECDWVVQPATTLHGLTPSGDVVEDARHTAMRDDQLRPIRDNGQADETLALATKPEGVMA